MVKFKEALWRNEANMLKWRDFNFLFGPQVRQTCHEYDAGAAALTLLCLHRTSLSLSLSISWLCEACSLLTTARQTPRREVPGAQSTNYIYNMFVLCAVPNTPGTY